MDAPRGSVDKKRRGAVGKSSPTTDDAPPRIDEKQQLADMAAAAERAVKGSTSISTGTEYMVSLARIVNSDNYRREPSNLARMGYRLVDKADPEHSLIDLCLSADMGTVRAVVALFEEHEGQQEDDEDADASVADRNTSIVQLAHKFGQVGQLQAVCVRPVGKDTWSLIFGQRRVAAAAYRHARSRVQVQDEVPGAVVVPAAVKAIMSAADDERAFMMAVAENSARKEDDPFQEGELYERMLKMTDPQTGRHYTLKRLADQLGVRKQRIRSYRALTWPRNEEKGTGLTDEDREEVRSGRKTVTWAIRRALNERHYSETGERQLNRGKPIPLRAMANLFDDTGETNLERRRAIAECMGFAPSEEGYAEAVRLSEVRIAEQEAKRMRRRPQVADTEA